MFDIGDFKSGSCDGITRRAFVKAGLMSPFAASLGRNLSAAEYGHVKAKSIILLYLWGGPSHIDTWDPKPEAPVEYRGPIGVTDTTIPGVQFSDLLPKLAKRAKNCTVVRSHQTWNGAHNPAGCMALTGQRDIKNPGPNFGSVISRFRSSDLPPFISVGRKKLRDAGSLMPGTGGGTWGSAYDPFPVTAEDTGEVKVPGLELLKGLTPERLKHRMSLLKQLDHFEGAADGGLVESWTADQQKAYSLLSSKEGREAFDLSKEIEKLRGQYGYTAFGQGCLLARRLAEVGVPYIQVNWSEYVEPYLGDRTDYGWDTHKNNFELLNDRLCPILDHAMSGLLDDLEQRGMLDDTLVVAMGEFGRTPRIDGNYSRGHWAKAYSSLWCGAGVKKGVVVGATDDKADHPITKPITPDMVGATMMKLAGITTEKRAQFRVLPTAEVIEELLA